MPSSYDKARSVDLWSEQDVNQFNKLDYYFALLQHRFFPKWNVFDKLFGSIPWQPNQGDTLRGVRPNPSPVGTQEFFPNPMTSAPNKDVHEVKESTEDEVLYRHLYESPYFHFLPSFQDFRRDQVQFATKDLTSHISLGHDRFIRSKIFHKSPQVFICGKGLANGEAELVTAPRGNGNSAGTAAKSTAWRQWAASQVANDVNGTLNYLKTAQLTGLFSDDLMIPHWEGMANGGPKDNEIISGKYLMIGSNEAWSTFTYDQHILSYKPDGMNLLNSTFKGILHSDLVWKSHRYPLRMDEDGLFPAPEIEAIGDYNAGETVPNPDYINAPFEWSFLFGADSYSTISIGTPPGEFNSTSMSEARFNKLNWNGKVRLTDNLLVNYGSSNLDTNKYGEYLQLIADVTHGLIPRNRRHCLPILHRRRKSGFVS